MKMTVSYEWLCDLVQDLNTKTIEEIGLALTAIGAETEDITFLNYGDSIKLAEIINIEPLKKIFKITIKTQSTSYTVISNSQNLAIGQYVLYAPIGTIIFGDIIVSDYELEEIKTDGLLLALENLGIESKSSDIAYLGNDLSIAQSLFKTYCEKDAIYTLDIPGNRADWLSVRGLARALAIYFDLPLKKYHYNFSTNGDTNLLIDIKSDRCTRYSLTKISNIYSDISSAKIQKRLLLLGMRPISYFVDISNIMMLETGQPTHAFDASKIKGKIIIRQAKDGETVILLNESEVTLTTNDLLICDEEKILALAGIMGSLNSGIDKDTKEIYLESANFNGVWIRRTTKRLGIKTESSLRFEKNITPELVPLAQKNICEIISQNIINCTICNTFDYYPNPQKKHTILVSPQEIKDYLGIPDISNEFINKIIVNIGCDNNSTKEKWIVTPSGERGDLHIKEDLIEEIARFYGYDNIPSNSYRPSAIQLNPEKSFEEKIRPLLRGMGLSEAITMVFRSEELKNFYCLNHFNSVTISNPLNNEWTELRTNLFDGLLESLKINITKSFQKNIALSEIATVFSKNNDQFNEHKILSFVISNEQNPYQNGLNILKNILSYAKIPDIQAQSISSEEYPFLHPLNSFKILVNQQNIGFFGEIHPVLLEKLDLSDKKDFPTPIICELLFDTLKEYASEFKIVEKINDLPPIFRDITLSVDENYLGINIISDLKKKNPLIKDIEFISVFQNDKLKEFKKKNISLKLRFESEQEINTQDIDKFIKELISN